MIDGNIWNSLVIEAKSVASKERILSKVLTEFIWSVRVFQMHSVGDWLLD